jgi:hypothetical protein
VVGWGGSVGLSWAPSVAELAWLLLVFAADEVGFVVDVVLEVVYLDEVVELGSGCFEDFIDVIMDDMGMELIIIMDGLNDGSMVGFDTNEKPDATDTVGATVGVS